DLVRFHGVLFLLRLPVLTGEMLSHRNVRDAPPTGAGDFFAPALGATYFPSISGARSTTMASGPLRTTIHRAGWSGEGLISWCGKYGGMRRKSPASSSLSCSSRWPQRKSDLPSATYTTVSSGP